MNSGIGFYSANESDLKAWTLAEEGTIELVVDSAEFHPLTRQFVLGGSNFIGRGEAPTGKVEIRDFSGYLEWSKNFPNPSRPLP